MPAVILHLSDIHIKSSQDPILKRGARIAASVNSVLPSATHVFIVVSGDVAYSGLKAEYDLAAVFFKEIQSEIRKEKDIPISFVVGPGNHDCDFEQNAGTRRMIVKNIEESQSPEIDTSVIETCTAIQKAFFDFRNELELDGNVNDDLLWRSKLFVVEGKTLGFECLNISWVSNCHETPGRLYFPIDRYQDKEMADVDTRVLVLHHPINWFNQSIYRKFRRSVRQLGDIVITGHEHQGNVGVNDDAESDQSVFIEGCVLYDDKKPSDSAFNVAQIDLVQSKFTSVHHKWKGELYEPTKQGSWTEYHDMPTKKINPFAMFKPFQDMIDDPGAFIKHPGSKHNPNITLTDIFVFPDLRKMGSTIRSRKRNIISSTDLLSNASINNGVIIEGDEKAGCTSLIYQYYRNYHDQGFVPLLIKGKDIKKGGEKELDELIISEVSAQYGRDHVTAFQQLSTTQKILFLDDFDDGPLRAADTRADLLCSIKKRFGSFIITVNEMFEMREMLDGDESRSLLTLTHYKLQPFGYVLRSKLVHKWFSLGADGTLDESQFIAKCDQAERLMKTVMTKTIIPKIPLYLLTLLQSMEAGRSGDFKDSGLGYYYQYLLTDAFQHAGVRHDKLTELFQYTAHLAWEFHVQQKEELTELDLRDFNKRFSEEWHTVDFAPRVAELLKSRVLQCRGEDYSFRYPYIYYYLKGQYLQENLNDENIRAYIGKCCKHLYVRDYANTVLFLAHHTTDDFLLKSISDALHNIIQHCTPITFNNDTTEIQKIIDDAPKLTYTGEKPAVHRKRLNEHRDDIDNGKDGLADKEEASDNLSFLAQILILFKTTEILGQILKNQYSKIQRTRKGELLEELFNGPLRVLHDFYNLIAKHPDYLIAEIDAALSRKRKSDPDGERKRIAKNVVAGLVQLISFAFVVKAGQGASSENLFEDVHNVVEKNGTLAFKLIELYIHLDSPKPLPRQMLHQVHGEAKSNALAERMIQFMVLNRLYMFKTTEGDMQWLSNVLKIDIGMQHSINYLDSKRKLLK
jgi:Calcineurin-like phosphoesterase